MNFLYIFIVVIIDPCEARSSYSQTTSWSLGRPCSTEQMLKYILQ